MTDECSGSFYSPRTTLKTLSSHRSAADAGPVAGSAAPWPEDWKGVRGTGKSRRGHGAGGARRAAPRKLFGKCWVNPQAAYQRRGERGCGGTATSRRAPAGGAACGRNANALHRLRKWSRRGNHRPQEAAQKLRPEPSWVDS